MEPTEIVEEAAKEIAKLKIDLACGDNKRAGFTGVDVVKTESADIVHDLNTYPWPFDDESCDEVHCSHFIEHMDGDQQMRFMGECYRIMTVGGKLTIICPYYSSIRAWQDPTHKRAISEMSFLYYNKGWRKQNKLEHYPITCDFDFVYGYAIDPYWASRSQEARDFAVKHYINVVGDIQVTLTKRDPKATA